MENLSRQHHLQTNWAELEHFRADLKWLLEHLKLKMLLGINGKEDDLGFLGDATFGTKAEIQS